MKAIAALLLALVALPGVAQKFIPKTIHFVGAPDYSDNELLTAAGLKKGALLDYAAINAAAQRLMDTGLFEGLTTKFDGLELTYTIHESDKVFPVVIGNLPLDNLGTLDEALHKQLPLYHGKVPGQDGYQEQVRAALEKMLSDNGLTATVLAVNTADPGHRNEVGSVTYSISTPEVHGAIAAINGVSAERLGRLQKIVDAAAKGTYDRQGTPSSVERAALLFYEDLGYAAATAKAERHGKAQMAAGGIVVPMELNIVEGNSYKLGKVEIPPDTEITQADLIKALQPEGMGAGHAVTSSITRIRFVVAMVKRFYLHKGYMHCEVTPVPSYDDATGMANYTFKVTTGDVYHLGFVKFDNVNDDLRHLLQRYWQMMPGDAFDAEYAGNFVEKAKLQDSVLARVLANVIVTYDATADPQTHDVNVVIHFAKKPQ